MLKMLSIFTPEAYWAIEDPCPPCTVEVYCDECMMLLFSRLEHAMVVVRASGIWYW